MDVNLLDKDANWTSMFLFNLELKKHRCVQLFVMDVLLPNHFTKNTFHTCILHTLLVPDNH